MSAAVVKVHPSIERLAPGTFYVLLGEQAVPVSAVREGQLTVRGKRAVIVSRGREHIVHERGKEWFA